MNSIELTMIKTLNQINRSHVREAVNQANRQATEALLAVNKLQLKIVKSINFHNVHNL